MSAFAEEQRNEISRWFRNVCEVKVGDLLEQRPEVLALHYLTPVEDVLNTLQELEIQSVAVYGPANGFIGAGGVELICGDRQYIGIVSVIDILAFSLKHEDYLKRKVSEVIGSTNESLTLWSEDKHQPLYFAMEQFCKGVHHALVYDSKDRCAPLKYLSQRDIAAYLIADTTSLPHLQTVLSMPVESISTCPVTPVYLSTPLTDAIPMLTEFSALPVVNEAGVVVSNLSASDFRGKSIAELRSSPDCTVRDLVMHQAMKLLETHPPFTVAATDSIFSAVSYMLRYQIHRLWVTPQRITSQTASGEPETVFLEGLGVLSFTDIIRAVYIAEK